MDVYGKIEASRKLGLSDKQIADILLSQPEAAESRKAGISDDQLLAHFGLNVTPPSRGVAGYIDTTLGNIPQDVMNIAQGAYGAVTNPLAALQSVAEAVESPVETGAKLAGATYKAITSPFETFQQAPVSTVLGLTAARGLAAPVFAGAGGVGRTAAVKFRNAFDPKARMYGEAFGPEMPQAINALAAARPGMTSAQALADINAPVIQSVGENVTKLVPQEARAIQQAQEVSRAARIGQIAGTPEELAAARAARAARAAENYREAFKQAAPEIPEEFFDRPSVRAAAEVADSIAAERGRPAAPMERLHDIKVGLDTVLKNPSEHNLPGLDEALKSTRKAFIDYLNTVPEYAKARAEFAAQSVPINKMQVAQELQKALTAPLTGETTRAGMFARAAEEAPKTIKRATGQTFFTKLEDVLAPEEMNVVNDIRDEFRRTQLAKDQAKLAKESGEKLASERFGGAPSWLNPIWTIVNTIVKRSLGKIDEKLATQIGMEMLDPKQLRKTLEAAQEYNARTEAIRRGAGERKTMRAPIVSGAVSFQNVLAPENRNAMAR